MTLQECIDRTIEQRDKFMALPDEAIDLDIVIDWRCDWWDANKDKIEDIEGGAKHTPCNSVGCIRGWTNADLLARGITDIGAFTYLGLGEHYTKSAPRFFYAQQRWGIRQRQEALDRFNTRIDELRDLQREETPA